MGILGLICWISAVTGWLNWSTIPAWLAARRPGTDLAQPDVAVAGSDAAAASEVQSAAGQALAGRRPRLLAAQQPLWDVLLDHYFRVEVDGWRRLPDGPSPPVGCTTGAR